MSHLGEDGLPNCVLEGFPSVGLDSVLRLLRLCGLRQCLVIFWCILILEAVETGVGEKPGIQDCYSK